MTPADVQDIHMLGLFLMTACILPFAVALIVVGWQLIRGR